MNQPTSRIANIIYYLDLLDLYSELLNPKQVKYFQLYFENNLTYAEIAKMFKITRAAVGEVIMKTKKQLLYFESKLHLLDLHKKRIAIIYNIKDKKLKKALMDLERTN